MTPTCGLGAVRLRSALRPRGNGGYPDRVVLTSAHRVGAWQHRVVALLVVFAAVLAYAALFGDHGLGRYLALRGRLAARSEAAYQRIERNRRLSEKLSRLRRDPHAIEEAARSTLGVVRENEVVLVFPRRRGMPLD